jgi:hypothetical protein
VKNWKQTGIGPGTMAFCHWKAESKAKFLKLEVIIKVAIVSSIY